MSKAIERLKARLDRDLLEMESELEAERLRSLPETELDGILAEDGFDFSGYKQRFDALLAPYLQEAGEASSSWTIPRAVLTEICASIADAFAAPALAVRTANRVDGTQPRMSINAHLPEGVPIPPEDLHWFPERLESVPEYGVIELTLRYLAPTPKPSTPPTITVHMDGALLPNTDPRYDEARGTLDLKLRGKLPEGDFAWSMESPSTERLEVHIDTQTPATQQ